MDWEKYTGKKNLTPDHPPCGDDHTVHLVAPSANAIRTFNQAVQAQLDAPVEPSYPTFDEVWEHVQSNLEARAYDGLPLQQAIVAIIKDAARIMYEALTEAQDKS